VADVVLREIVARLGLEVDESAFEKAEHGIHSLKGAFAAVGAVLGAVKAALVAVTVETIESANQARVAGERLGMTAQSYQELGYAADQAEVSHDALAHSMLILSRNADAAQHGSTEMQAHFARLGITLTDGHGKLKTSTQLLEEASDKFKDIKNPTEKAALAMQIFGRGGAEIIPLLNKGGEALREYREEANELGIVMSEDFIEKSERFHEGMTKLKGFGTGLRNAIAATFVDGLVKKVDTLNKILHVHGKLIKEEVIRVLQALANAFQAPITIVSELVGWFLKATAPMEGFRNGLLGVLGVLGLIAVVTSFPLVALGLLAALLVLVLDDFVVFQRGGKSVIGDLVHEWQNFIAALGEEHPVFAWIFKAIDKLLRLLHFIGSGQLGEEIATDREETTAARMQGSFAPAHPDEGMFSRGARSLMNGLFGGAPSASPIAAQAAAQAQASAPVVNAPNMSVQMSVTAAPGESAEQTAQASAVKMQEWFSAQLRATQGAMLPYAVGK
jgi:hypothetical protein